MSFSPLEGKFFSSVQGQLNEIVVFSSMAQKIWCKTVLIELEPFSIFTFDDMTEQPTVLYDVYYASQQWYNKQISKSVRFNVCFLEEKKYQNLFLLKAALWICYVWSYFGYICYWGMWLSDMVSRTRAQAEKERFGADGVIREPGLVLNEGLE